MLKVIGGVPEGEYKAIASGSLPNGKPVVVNADGTVSVISETPASQALGTPEEHQSTGVENTVIVYSGIENKFVIFFRDSTNSNYGTARVITVDPSDNSITYGAKVVYHSAYTEPQGGCLDVASGNVVSSYKNISAEGEVVVGTVSGTSITFGTAATMNQNDPDVMCARYDPTNQKVVFCYVTNDNYGRARVGTVSGTSISFGSEYVFASASTQLYQQNSTMTYDASADKMVIVFKDVGNSNYGKAIVVTVSGTTLSFGAETTYQSAKSEYNAIAYDPSSGKNLIAYYYNDTNGRAVVGTVSGTSISFGSITSFDSGRTFKMSMVGSTLAGKVTIAYEDDSDSEKGKIIVGTISGTDPTFGSEVVFDSNAINETAIDIDPNSGKIVIGYAEKTSNDGRSVVFQPEQLESNLTAENYIGMSRGVVEVTGSASQVIGSETDFETGGRVEHLSAAYDANAQKVVIAYRDNTNSNYGTAIVGTVSGTSISFGTAVVYHADATNYSSIVYDENAQKVVIAYQDDNDSNKGTAVVGTVSGTSISFGTPTVFDTDNAFINTVYDANAQKIVISYQDGGNSNYGTAVVGTVSGTSISFGTPVVYESADTRINDIVYDSVAQKVIVAYRDFGNSDAGTARVGTVSGTSISFGTVAVFDSGGTDRLSAAYDVSADATVIFYGDKANSYYGTAIVGTVSGTSISFGTKQVFESAEIREIGATYDSVAQRAVLGYRDVGNTERGTIIAAQVDGTVMTFSTPEVFAENPRHINAAYDSDQENVVFVYDDENALRGRACVVQVGYENISRYPVADGDPARVDIIGSVSDNQLSLTAGEKYYVQTDGTLSTTAGSPSVLAGTAISATKLVVKT
jgi:hypothetical protein